MKRILLKGKIHRASVTNVDLDYEGSLGLDEALMAAADLLPYEKIDVYDITNGERFSTYLVKESAGSGKVSVYGAAAHKVSPKDKLIIAGYGLFDEDEIEYFTPRIVLLDENNRIKEADR